MSYSTCVIGCDKCGDAAGVDLSSGLCLRCRVMKRREEEELYFSLVDDVKKNQQKQSQNKNQDEEMVSYDKDSCIIL